MQSGLMLCLLPAFVFSFRNACTHETTDLFKDGQMSCHFFITGVVNEDYTLRQKDPD